MCGATDTHSTHVTKFFKAFPGPLLQPSCVIHGIHLSVRKGKRLTDQLISSINRLFNLFWFFLFLGLIMIRKFSLVMLRSASPSPPHLTLRTLRVALGHGLIGTFVKDTLQSLNLRFDASWAHFDREIFLKLVQLVPQF